MSLKIWTHILQTLPLSTILKAFNIFTNQVPELRILHATAFVALYQNSSSKESRALLATVIAVVKRLPRRPLVPELERLLPAARYVDYARVTLLSCILASPRIEIVQALLILTLYEWGTRDFHQAWIHCGIAIRIMQSLHSSRVAPFPLDISEKSDANELSAAIESRAYWACFILDCTINSGYYTPRMLPMVEMSKLRVSRPLSTVEFAFGSKQGAESIPKAFESTSLTLDASRSFEIMVGGFDIYSKVMDFVFMDGRRAPGMSAPENCPWVTGSVWNMCRAQLESWRLGQHKMLLYPAHGVAVHMALGYGESFVYLNLIYYMCRMMLQREYLPFLPKLETTPQGPTDPPFLEADAPPGWWDGGAQELFESSECIASLLHDASQLGISVCTPFSGFCAFTACFVNMYITYFPNMNFGRSQNSKILVERGQDYLREFQNTWSLADGWIKTLKTASVLYERATSDRQRYRNKTRFDFEILHQSVHEYRVADRSEEHMLQINQADTQSGSPASNSIEGHQYSFLPSAPFPLADIEDILDDQTTGMWPNWWSMLEDVDLSNAFPGQ